VCRHADAVSGIADEISFNTHTTMTVYPSTSGYISKWNCDSFAGFNNPSLWLHPFNRRNIVQVVNHFAPECQLLLIDQTAGNVRLYNFTDGQTAVGLVMQAGHVGGGLMFQLVPKNTNRLIFE
jgi:hypothetical protein